MIPELVAVKSSNAAKIGYAGDENALFVQFHPTKSKPDEPGALWKYSPVPEIDFERLILGESVGKYVASLKKDPSISAQRVTEGVPA